MVAWPASETGMRGMVWLYLKFIRRSFLSTAWSWRFSKRRRYHRRPASTASPPLFFLTFNDTRSTIYASFKGVEHESFPHTSRSRNLLYIRLHDIPTIVPTLRFSWHFEFIPRMSSSFPPRLGYTHSRISTGILPSVSSFQIYCISVTGISSHSKTNLL